MIPKVFQGFIKKVLQQTESGMLVWSEGEFGSYVCDHKEFTLYIKRHFNEDRDRESVMFRFRSGDKYTPFVVNDDDADFDQMVRLFDAIVANANTVSEDLGKFFD
ncbi:hypothetical protein ABE473_17385 [Stenotrophomonas sp. TWI700]|uniref:hypothetical protein n=1 Tax=Stenotrophomonas sp. TWI700 TaxID=3136792 RepID=UPI0032099729